MDGRVYGQEIGSSIFEIGGNMKGLVEICCQSFEGVQLAEKLGADQVELNSGLYLGGLTPSFGLVKRIKRELSIPVMAMVRPRPGGFNYSYSEYLTILEDVECLLEVGVDGIVLVPWTKILQ